MSTGYTTVSGTKLTDASGATITNATIYFQPCNHQGVPISFQVGSGGQSTDLPISAQVIAGSFTVQLADTTLTNPVNVAYLVTVVGNVSGKQMLGPGYLIQPSGSEWSFDSFVPALGALTSISVGPVGPVGPAPVPRGGYSALTSYNVNDLVQQGGSTYISLVGSNVGHDPANSGQWSLYAAKGVNGTPGTSAFSIIDAAGHGDFVNSSTAATENYAKLQTIIATVGSGVTVRFPFIAGQTNKYLFTTADYTALSQCIIDADQGVTLVFSASIDSLYGNGKGAQFVRPVPVILQDLGGIQIICGSETHKLPITKTLYLTDGDLIRSSITAVDCTKLNHVVYPWPGSPAYAPFTPTSVNAGSVVNPIDTSSLFYSNFLRVAPGDDLSCLVSAPSTSTTGQFAVVVRATDGHAWVASGNFTEISAPGMGKYTISTTSFTTATGITWPGLGSHGSYAMAFSVVGIRITGYSTFDVTLNGVVVYSGTAPGQIYEAGFASYEAGDHITFKDWTVRRNNEWSASSPLANVLIIGDSKSAPRIDCWPNYFQEYLDATSGIRAVSVNNYAISGATSAAQLANLESLGVPNPRPTVCIIDIGTNDVQTLSGVTGLISNVQATIAFVQASAPACKFVIAAFSLWYTQAQRGTGIGQPSGNYEFGAPYRTALMALAATNGYTLLDNMEPLSFILSNFSPESLALPLYGAVDMMQDNIHPSSFGARLQAFNAARTVAGMLTPKPTLDSGWIQVPASAYVNGAVVFTSEPLRYRIDRSGYVHFDGTVDITACTIADGLVPFTLPASLLPDSVAIRVALPTGPTGTARAEILPTGLTLYNFTSTAPVHLFISGVTYKINNGSA